MNKDKDLERLIDKLMEEAPLEAPSNNFTDAVMAKVEEVKNVKLVYKPLITKTTFIIWAIVLGSLTFYLLSLDTSANSSINTYLSIYSETRSWIPDSLMQLQLSNKVIYVVGAFALMIYFQAQMLKRFYNQRFA